MAKYSFGSGQMFSMPVAGTAPLKFGALQDVSVEFSSDLKMMYGQEQFALAIGRGHAKVDVKAGVGAIDTAIYNQTYFGQTVTTGEKKQIVNEAGTIPTTPFQVTAANGANFFMDLGVFYALTGLRLTQVPTASTPTTGQYKVSAAGVYTFAAADTGLGVLLNYLYTSSATGSTLTINNLLMGTAPTFQLVLGETFQSKQLTLVLYSCVSDKLGLPFKQDDFMVADFNCSAQANDAGQIGFLTSTG